MQSLHDLLPNKEESDAIFSLPDGSDAAQWETQLMRGWQAFIQGAKPHWIRRSILQSWARSREYHIDPTHFCYTPTNPSELAAILSHNSELIAVAHSVMENLLAYNPDGHINLTDAQGVVLSFCGSDLTPVGSVLREEILGTNCTARCLREQRLVYVLSGENWKIALRKRNRQCAAAPIRDASGRMTGVLTLTATPDNFNAHTLGTVQAAAEAIGQQLTLHRLLAEQQSILENLNEGVVVCDREGGIKTLNRYARQIFAGIDAGNASIDQLLQPQSGSLLTLPCCNDREMVFRPDGRHSVSCLVSLMPAPDGGRILSFRENQRIRAITRRVLGVRASYTFDMIRGQAPTLQQALQDARASSRSDSTVLLTGESGTGKELFAQAIHNASSRAHESFVAVNCGALPRDLVQSELFGYVDGAFTGSRRGGSAGKFELADGGTLFLDEIGEMPLEAQTSLLRVLQESEVLRIGAAHPVKVDVRIIAATHCDLQSAVEQGAFRRDLFYRLNVISLTIPPLRERQSDIPDLVNTFIRTLCQRLNKLPPQVSPEAMNTLETWHWPGNVRELENLMERIVNLCQSNIIDLVDLPPAMVTRSDAVNSTPASSLLQDNERACILQTLRAQGGNMRQSARLLGISRTALYNKLNQWNIAIDTLRQ
ncbi:MULTISPECIES: sigma 54-interacting transcriptional regulator [unclassified Pantoea]|uniref:sigma-54-dependent Fis family transcriptional regulator n=1 Tax=unclassified Pantoea TaxID=2630326 RepID=UPI0024775492|nr:MULTISPECIES: sigma 54-interacting transcriptional regulator [unclassified Pantoea]GME46079.1 sigma 54-interacting transcriptional regulator [Pantoea sp. QMID1]GME46634.1 sigma 54-interacting transcriptional regulator [Pantoea sp. QMID3]GME61428.1 sigma 54-interacting transcriptional regulator [Pantoea sp. QMID4]GME63131.1 sigma 54-interacting transcriptional regulator [Pantoea sp. QMID2]